MIYSVCVNVQLLCALAPMCRGLFDIWRPGVIPQMKDLDESLGFGARLVRSSAQSLAPQHVSGALGVQVRVNPEPADSAKSAPFRSRRARAVLELCHGDPWLSAPFRRRGAHVVPSRDLNAALLAQKGLAVVLNLCSSGRIWYFHVEWGVYNWSSKSVACLLWIVSACSRHLVLMTLKLSVSPTRRLLNRVLSVFRPPSSFFTFEVLKSGSG